MNRREYERAVIAEIQSELAVDDPVTTRLIKHSFVSTSKGKNRPRRHWQEIELIADTARPERPLAYRTARLFPWDDVSREIFRNLSGSDGERKVKTDLRIQTC